MHGFFTESALTFEGVHYQCHDLRLTPRPVQRPFPIYLAGSVTQTPSRVARWGSGWFLSRAQIRNIKGPVDALARCLEEVGRERREIDLVVTKGLSLGTSREQAIERFQASLLPGRMDELSVEFCLEGRPSTERHFEQNLIGTPAQVAEQLEAVRDSGVDHCVIMYFAVMEMAALLEQLQWFGEEVLPLLSWRADRAED